MTTASSAGSYTFHSYRPCSPTGRPVCIVVTCAVVVGGNCVATGVTSSRRRNGWSAWRSRNRRPNASSRTTPTRSRSPLVSSRSTVAGTIAAARFALRAGLGMNLGGGTHHAGRAFARGYCVFNDVAVALARVRADGGATRALVVDCDVHQGDGTADLLGADPDCFTLSLHGARNYPFQRIPSDLDVDIAGGTSDERYLEALDAALDHAIPRAE